MSQSRDLAWQNGLQTAPKSSHTALTHPGYDNPLFLRTHPAHLLCPPLISANICKPGLSVSGAEAAASLCRLRPVIDLRAGASWWRGASGWEFLIVSLRTWIRLTRY